MFLAVNHTVVGYDSSGLTAFGHNGIALLGHIGIERTVFRLAVTVFLARLLNWGYSNSTLFFLVQKIPVEMSIGILKNLFTPFLNDFCAGIMNVIGIALIAITVFVSWAVPTIQAWQQD